MTTERHFLQFQICIRSPFIMADVDAAGIGIDTPALRNSAGHAVLPASHLKGLLREGLKALTDVAPVFTNAWDIGKLFGPALGYNSWVPERSQMHFSDCTYDPSDFKSELTRITIDEATGTVATGMLQVVELVAPLGKDCSFSGEILWHGTRAKANELVIILQKALRLIPYFGGIRSAGFGQHLRQNSTVTLFKSEAITQTSSATIGKRYRVHARFDRPIAVNIKQVADNVFMGGDVVPGSAIKGAVADMLKLLSGTPAQNAALSATRISHAFPLDAQRQKLSRSLPMSHAWYANHAAFRDELGRGESAGFMADGKIECGDFIPDMKNTVIEKLRDKLDRKTASFSAYSLGHTAISSETGAAQEGYLFVTIAKDTKGCQFEFTIDVPELTEAQIILDILKGGLDRVGKTGARMVDVLFAEDTVAALPASSQQIIVLETPALLIIQNPNDPDDLQQMIKRYFDKQNITLLDHFVQRELVGGYPVYRNNAAYQPYSLVQAGSCFLVEATPALDDLRKNGLPVYRETNGQLVEETDWQKCVYLPQNGFGEISVSAFKGELL